MKAQILIQEINTLVRRNDDLKLAIAKANRAGSKHMKVSSIDRWLREDAVMLTTATNLAIIRHYLGLAEDAVLTEEVELTTA